MNEEPFFSIIIPTYNRAEYIGKTLESVAAQTFSSYEVVIVDDGSTDHTAKTVEKWLSPNIRYVYQENGERGKARNKGISMAKGKYITFLDSDDLFYPNHLELAAKNIAKYQSPLVYRQNYELRAPNGQLQGTPEIIKDDPNLEILKGNFFSCIGVFIHASVTAKHVFCEDRRLSYTEDWEYWLRLSVRYKFYNCNKVTSCMIDHSDRSSRQFDERKMRVLSALLLFNLRHDEVFYATRSNYMDQIKANMLSLMALMKVSAGHNQGVFCYLKRAIRLSPRELIRRRSLAIVKHSLFNLTRA